MPSAGSECNSPDLEKGLGFDRSSTVVEHEEDSPALTAAEVKELISGTITEPLQNYPLGFPLQAAFQSSEPSWSVYRGFGYLHARVIIDLQDEIRCLEKSLAIMDKMDDTNGEDFRLMSRDEQGEERTRLISNIREKLLQYDEILLKARDMNTLQKPSDRDYKSIRTWFWNKKPVYEEEAMFIKRREDLLSLRHGREWSSFDGLVENCLRKMHCPLLQRIFATKELLQKNGDDKHVIYYSPARVEKLVGIIITFIIFVLLVLPVVAMYKLTTIGERNSTLDAVGVLVVFTLLFSAAMSLLTKAQRHELFAASAAYCAVLVVFISNFNDTNTANGNAGRG